MNAVNKVRPYLFWIAAGAVLLVELAIVLLVSPSDPAGRSAPEVKADLDARYGDLQKLSARADGPPQKGPDPTGLFNPEDPAQIKSLTTEYLVTQFWGPVLLPHVQKYGAELKDIADYLSARSKPLHQPVAQGDDLFQWYQAYEARSSAVVAALLEAKCLVVPTAGSAGSSPFGAGSGRAAAGGAADSEGVSRAARDTAGFFTKGEAPPAATEHERLTTRYHLVDQVAQIILATRQPNRANPVTGRPALPAPDDEQRSAAITGIVWDESAAGGAPNDGLAEIRLSVSLAGPLSAVLATQSALENNADEEHPLLVMLGGALAPKSPYAVGERKDVPSETVTAKLDLVALDFSTKTYTPPVAAPPPAKKRAPAAATPTRPADAGQEDQ